jgi:hypothetical protein
LAAKEWHDSRVRLIAPLPSFDVLLAGAAVAVERDDALRRPRQVRDDEADPRIEPARVPLDLGDHSPAWSMIRLGNESWRSSGAPHPAVARLDTLQHDPNML